MNKTYKTYKTYFITLKPCGLYFFGGEQKEEKTDYYLKGNPLPQQTALLGMVRYQILKQNNLLDETNTVKENAKDFIGKKSFCYEDENVQFGKIKRISPCYIVDIKTQERYLPTAPQYLTEVKVQGENYYFPEFDHKAYYAEINWDVDFYETVERSGNDKNYFSKTEDEAFYKQVWFKMKGNYAFGFYLELEDDVAFANAEVALGKENSYFKMEVSTTDEIFPTDLETPNANAVTLTCDAYVDKDFLAKCDFAVCDTVPFRNLANKTEKNHNHYGKHKSEKRLQLLKRGSAFIVKNKDLSEITKSLKHYKNFRDIGYNSYKTIQIKIS